MIKSIRQNHLFTNLYSLGNLRRFQTIIGNIAKDEKFAAIAKNVTGISKKYLEEKNITSESLRHLYHQPISLNLPVEQDGATANFYGWQRVGLIPPRIEEGIIKILNSDKETLINSLAYLHETGQIQLKKKILVVNEGCDTGDYLMRLLPFLVSVPRSSGFETSVILTNGHAKKLQGAARLAGLLLSPESVSFHIANAFKELPPGLEKYSDFQKLHLFFRLVVVARPYEITQFIASRLHAMDRSDIAVASFLCADEKAINAMDHANVYQEKTEDFTILAKKPSESFRYALKNLGVTDDNLNTYVTAFTEKWITETISKYDGKILHMLKMPSTTDKRKDITIIGVVITKK